MDDEGEDSSAKDDQGGEDNEPSGVVEAKSFEVSFHVLSCFGLVGWRSCFPGMGFRSWGEL